MGLQPTRVNENPQVIPRTGTPWRAPTMAGKGDFQESRWRRRISQCLGNTQSEIPRCARNDSPREFSNRL